MPETLTVQAPPRRWRPGEWLLWIAGGGGLALLAAVPLLLVIELVMGLGGTELDLRSVGWATLGSAGLALVTAAACVPLTLAAVLWLEIEVVPRLRPGLQTLVVSLVGMPSVVVAYLGLVILRPALPLSDEVLLVLLLVAMGLPHAVGRGLLAVRTVPRERVDAALALGLGRSHILRRLVLPTAWPGLVAAAAVGGLRAMSDTVVVLLLLGEGATTPVLTVEILDRAGSATAALMALILLVLSGGLTTLVHRLGRGPV